MLGSDETQQHACMSTGITYSSLAGCVATFRLSQSSISVVFWHILIFSDDCFIRLHSPDRKTVEARIQAQTVHQHKRMAA